MSYKENGGCIYLISLPEREKSAWDLVTFDFYYI